MFPRRAPALLVCLLATSSLAPTGLAAQDCGGRSGVVGDVSGDGTVNVVDAQRIARSSAGLPVPEPGRIEPFGDVNEDGSVNVIDAQIVARHAAGRETSHPVGEPCAVTPSVQLTVALDIATATGGETLEVAEGESVVLAWTTADDPDGCTAEGAWGGARSPAGGEVKTSPLAPPGTRTFVLSCSNEAGSDSDTVVVSVGARGEVHALSDREDDVEGAQVHLVYVVPEEGPDERWDLDGTMMDSLSRAQDWLRSETGGRELRIDTYDGEPDLSFARLPMTDDEIADLERVGVAIWKELERRGFTSDGDPPKKFVAYYDGPLGSKDGGGLARDPYGVVMFSGGGHALTMLHEVFHNLGVVDEGAPNRCDGAHVCDSARDLMRGPSATGPAFPKILDVGGDDYYAEDLPEHLTNLFDSSFLAGG